MNKIYIPYYKGKIQLSKVIGYVTLDELLRAIQDPKPHIKRIIQRIKTTTDHKDKRALKHKLYSFTVGAFVGYYKKRTYKNIEYYTGLMQLDFDKVGGEDELHELKLRLYNKPYILAVFYSPSGKGIKAIARIKQVCNAEQFKNVHRAIKQDLNEPSFDIATSNPILPMFISWDEELYWRELKDTAIFDKEIEPTYTIPTTNVHNTPTNKNKNWEEKTIRIFTTKINSIQDNGHPQLRDACLILGSRVAAEYIGYNKAVALAEQLVLNNQYLQKDVKNYLRTAEWGIKTGYKNGGKYY